MEGASVHHGGVHHPSPINADRVSIPPLEQLLEAFQELGTVTAVARFFGISRRTVDRWTSKLGLEPELRPELPIKQLLSGFLSELVSRTRVAQWIVDEASISVAYNSRTDSTSLLLVGAMNDDGAMEAIAQILAVHVGSGAVPSKGRLPTHIIRVQGTKAFALLGLVMKELTGLKALEAKATLTFFPASGFVKGKLTTDIYMGGVWRQFAKQSAEAWNKKRRSKLSPPQIDEMVEAWIQNRTARARRGIGQYTRAEVQGLLT